MNNTRVIYLDIIKIFAIILVIFNHSHWGIYGYNVFGTSIHMLLFDLCKIAVPLFVMVSGALILGKESNHRDMITKRIFRVFVPLVIVTLICVLVYGGSFKGFIAAIFTNYTLNYPPYWLWYLYLLMALYIMTPFLQKMLKNFDEMDYRYFILMFVLFVSFLNMLPFLNNLFLGANLKVNDAFLYTLFPVGIGYYVAGYYLSKKEITSKMNKINIIGFILSLLLGTVLLIYGMFKGFSLDEIVNYSFITVAVPAIFGFMIFKYYFSKPLKHEKLSKIIVNVSNCVFGVYLFHTFFIEFLQNTPFIIMIANIDKFLAVFILDAIVFIGLTFIIWLLRKLPYVKKFL